jgi:hypothetical protein
MRKMLFAAFLSLVVLMATGFSLARTPPTPNAPMALQSEPDSKAVSGTIASIGNNGQSFALTVNDGSTKQTMQFVVDKTTHVEGIVKVGTSVTVEYQAKGGENLALTVTAQA